jgi:general L-amino acid transport system permease protein
MGVAIWLIVGFLAARQGATLRDKYSARNATLGAAISGLLWLITFIAPPLVISAAVSAGIMRETTAQNLIPLVDTRRWGGLLLTLVLTVVTILASFPIGVLLALGRRSSLPAVRWVCTAFIELVRGVPLITVLFLGMLLVPLINPALSNVDNAIRAMVGFTLFSAAYLAENVRGGLQSVPYGQEEAARALGLSNLQVTMLITLPQALRAVIPALVGQCIALFKDTSLVALVGLTDLTGISKGVVAQSEYVGLQTEVFVFISVIYFVFSYVMAYISRRIEASGSGAARRI